MSTWISCNCSWVRCLAISAARRALRFLCCVPMAMPQSHLVAFCSDVGIPASQGAVMLSVLLGCAFISRQFWGVVADRIGGLRTILAGSACQITAMIGFLLTQNEIGLFMVSAWFGLGFSDHPGLCAGGARAVPGFGGLLAGAERAAVQRLRDGVWRLARRHDLRHGRVLCCGVCDRDRFQRRASLGHRHAGLAASLHTARLISPNPGGLQRDAASLTLRSYR
jgi:hypothetical protein